MGRLYPLRQRPLTALAAKGTELLIPKRGLPGPGVGPIYTVTFIAGEDSTNPLIWGVSTLGTPFGTWIQRESFGINMLRCTMDDSSLDRIIGQWAGSQQVAPPGAPIYFDDGFGFGWAEAVWNGATIYQATGRPAEQMQRWSDAADASETMAVRIQAGVAP